MTSLCRLLSLSFLFAGPLCAAPPAALAPFLEQHCYECHDSEVKKGGLDITTLGGKTDDLAALARWVRLYDRVRDGEMPPAKKPRPAAADQKAFLQTLGGGLTKWHTQAKSTVLRRLNRTEYENTLNDLLGVHVDVASMLPEDGKAHGFDNIGEALDLSPVQLQRQMEAAGKALDAAVAWGPRPERRVHELRFDTGKNREFVGKNWFLRPDGAVVFYNEGGYPAIKPDGFKITNAGPYRMRIHEAAHQSTKPVLYGLFIGADTFDKSAEVYGWYEAPPGEISVRTIDTWLDKNDTVRLRPQLAKMLQYKQDPATFTNAPGLAILKIEVEGPLLDAWPPRGHTLRYGDLAAEDTGNPKERNRSYYRPKYVVKSANPAADLARLLPPFVAAAFRRPVAADEVAPYLALAKAELDSGASLDQALRTAQVAVLTAPDFLYLLEPAGTLPDRALAARLSYLLWSSAPDDALLALAAKGQLAKPAVLREQTERMLRDRRAARFTRNFTGQWLNLREIDATTPDKQLYPEYDEQLKDAMVRETELFFDEVLRANLSVANFLHSDWTFLNERLARQYGITNVTGTTMRKVTLQPEHRRGGVLTQAAVLKVSANGTTTSPVTRGAFVLERILGIPPAPPPPGTPGIEPDIRGATTLREQLEKHRTTESCNSCHRVIDPPGFALENYDVMGGWRENYRALDDKLPKPSALLTGGRGVKWRVGPPVDPTGVTKDGRAFANLTEYKKILLARPEEFTRVLAEKLATYATGRGMGFSDRAELDRIARAVAAKKNGLRDLVHEVVRSEIFRTK